MNQVQYQRSAIQPGDAVGQAWEMVSGKLLLYVGLGFVTVLLVGCVPFVGWFLFGPVMAGFYYIGLRDMRGEAIDFGMLFKGFDKFLPLMIIGIIQQFPGIIMTIIQYTVDIARLVGQGTGTPDVNFLQSSGDIIAGVSMVVVVMFILMAIVGIVWTVALSFAIPLVLEHDLSVGDALVTSLKAAGSNAGGLIVLMIFNGLVGLLGLIAICLGLLVAIPVIYLANVVAYRQVFPYFDRGQAYDAPPPPDYYAGSFGRGQ